LGLEALVEFEIRVLVLWSYGALVWRGCVAAVASSSPHPPRGCCAVAWSSRGCVVVASPTKCGSTLCRSCLAVWSSLRRRSPVTRLASPRRFPVTPWNKRTHIPRGRGS